MAKTKGAKNGKYGANIDKAQFEKLCSILCTEQEICGFFSVSHDTLNRWCHQEYDMTFTEIFEHSKLKNKKLIYVNENNSFRNIDDIHKEALKFIGIK